MAKRKKSAHIVLDAKKLRSLRQHAVLSQEALALKADVATKTVERLEAGHPCYPDTVSRIAVALDVSPEALLPGVESPSNSPISSGSLPPFPRLFVGRDSDVDSLREKLIRQKDADDTDHRMTVVHGWPGVGKTTLTAAITHDAEIRNAFPDGVLWASLGQNPDLDTALQRWADDLGFDAGAKSNNDLTRQLAALLWNKQMLVIVDDIWDSRHFAPFDIGGAGCATLVTSRHPKVGNELAPKSTDIVQLDCLNADHSLELLSKLAGEDVVQDYLAQCKELAVDLEGLPLALNVAGCWLRSAVRKGWDVAEEFADLRDMTRVLESTAPANMSAFLDESNNITVAALLKKSTDCLKQESLYRFATLGAYPAKPAVFPLSMVSRAWETQEEGARETVNELMDFGLMERTDASLLWIHSLLVAFAKTLWVEDE